MAYTRKELKPIEVRDDAEFIPVGKQTRLIVQPSEWQGKRQIQVATQSAKYGRLDGYEDVPNEELTVEMCGIRHGTNITHEVWEALMKFGDPDGLAVAAPAAKTRGTKA